MEILVDMRTGSPALSALVALLVVSNFSTAQSSSQGKQAGELEGSQEAVVIERHSTRVIWAGDGTGARETEGVFRVQADAGVQQLAVLTFPYASANESVDIDYVRVLKPGGAVVDTPAYNIQDMPGEVTRVAPMYSDIREKHVAVKALGVGDVLEYKVRYRILKSDVPGQFWFDYSFEKNFIVKHEELEVNVPRGKYVNISSAGIKPSVKEEGDRRIYAWSGVNLRRDKDAKPSAPKREVPPPDVQISTFHTWDEVGRWYRGLQAAQAVATLSVRSKAAELIKGLTSDDQRIEALYSFVATRIHYISLAFGTGRYTPHAADEVIDNGYGDCKDKHTLLAALLKAAGYEAWPALIHTERRIAAEVPSPAQFNHLITVVPRADSLVWLDTTPEVAPYGLLMPNLRDKQALVIPTDKAPALMRTSAVPPFASMQSFVAEGKLGSDGTFKGKIERGARGDAEVVFRVAFRATSPAQWNKLVQGISYGSGFAGEVTGVTASAPEDTQKPFHFSYEYTRKQYSDWANRRITPPLPPFGIEPADDDNSKPTEPVVLGAPGEVVYRAKVALPAGYTVTVPDKLDLVTDYAEYHAQYGFEKGTLTALRRLIIKKPEVPLSELDAYRKFQKAVTEEEGNWINVAARDASGNPTVAELDSDDADALTTSGKAALDAHNYGLAADLLNKAVKINPRNKWAWNNLGLAYMGLLRFDDAASALRKQIEVSPSDQYAYNNLGRVLEIQGRRDEAEQAFRKQIAISPQDRWAHSNLGALLLREKRYGEAVLELEVATAISGNNPATDAALGEAYLQIGQTEKGIAALDKAVQNAPSPPLFNNVAYILADKGVQLDKARQFAESAVSSLGGLLRDLQLKDLQVQHLYYVDLLGNTWDTLGWVYYRQGNLEQAERYLLASWSLGQHAEVGDHLGQLYERQGKKSVAAQFYARAMASSRPPKETRQRLVAVAGSEKDADVLVDRARIEISGLRTTTVPRVTPHHATGEFFVSFLPGPKVDEVKFISGDQELSTAVRALASAKYDVIFPDGEVTKLVRRGILACPESGSSCQFVLLLPADVHSVN